MHNKRKPYSTNRNPCHCYDELRLTLLQHHISPIARKSILRREDTGPASIYDNYLYICKFWYMGYDKLKYCGSVLNIFEVLALSYQYRFLN